MGLAVAVLLALGGCGGSSGSSSATKTTATTSASNAIGRQQSIAVTSSAGTRYGPFNARYTCHGPNVSPSIEWTGVTPEVFSGTKELIVLVRTISRGPIVANWALAGLKPSVHKIAEGETPAGAIVGLNSFGKLGYSVCPPAHATVAFVTIAVYAMPTSLGLKPGFNAESVRPKLEHNGKVLWGGLTTLAVNKK